MMRGVLAAIALLIHRRTKDRFSSWFGSERFECWRSGGAIFVRRSFGGVLVFQPLFFCKCLSSQLIRKSRENWPATIAKPHREERPILGDYVCGHTANMAWQPSELQRRAGG